MKRLLLLLCLTSGAMAQNTENLKTKVTSSYAYAFKTLGVKRVDSFALVNLQSKQDAQPSQLLYRWHPGRGWIQVELIRAGPSSLSVQDLLECGFTRKQMSRALGRPLNAQELQSLGKDRPFSTWLSNRKLAADQPHEGLGSDPWLLMLLRNEIYARHGRAFQDQELRAIFAERSWYHADPRFNDALLTDLERQNVKVLLQWEQHPLTKLTVINP